MTTRGQKIKNNEKIRDKWALTLKVDLHMQPL